MNIKNTVCEKSYEVYEILFESIDTVEGKIELLE